MKILMIGGTGNISMSITRLLSDKGNEVVLLNRGNHPVSLPHVRSLTADIRDEAGTRTALGDETFDAVADFICFTPDQAETDIRLFSGRTRQFIFISSASAYRKPLGHVMISESTPLHNPYWLYSRNKQACEELFMKAWRENGFPITIVRPSHTFSDSTLPVPIHGDKGPWQIVRRMLDHKPVPVCGDGESLWAVLSSDEFARAFVGLLGHIGAIGEAVHITGEELLTWNQILRTTALAFGGTFIPCYVPSSLLARTRLYDYTGAMIGDKSNSVMFDTRKLHRLNPAYHQEETFHQAIARTAAHYRRDPDIMTLDPAFDAFCDKLCVLMEETGKAIEALT